MRLITLLAGYAAWLAVAMKYRREAGTSKLGVDPKQSKIDAFIDEVVDLHKSAITDAKSAYRTHFGDIESFDDLKAKVTTLIDSASDEAESYIASMRARGADKKEILESEVDAFFAEKNKILEEAKDKWAELTDTATDTVTSWIESAKSRLLLLRDSMKENIKFEMTVEKTPVKKSTAKTPLVKKPVIKKPVAKKAPAKKTPEA